jgi:hypothetical protein
VYEVAERIVRPLELGSTAPYPRETVATRSLVLTLEPSPQDADRARAGFDAAGFDRAAIEAALAQGYARAWGQSLWPSGLAGPLRPMSHAFPLSATAGLVASALDVARFSIALDDGHLLRGELRERAWTPPVAEGGERLPYGSAGSCSGTRGSDWCGPTATRPSPPPFW